MLLGMISVSPVTAAKKKSVKSIKLNKKSIKIYTDETYKLRAKVNPSSYTKKLNWKSSDRKVVTVSGKGKLTPRKAGRAVITAFIGKKKAKCKVTVEKWDDEDDDDDDDDDDEDGDDNE